MSDSGDGDYEKDMDCSSEMELNVSKRSKSTAGGRETKRIRVTDVSPAAATTGTSIESYVSSDHTSATTDISSGQWFPGFSDDDFASQISVFRSVQLQRVIVENASTTGVVPELAESSQPENFLRKTRRRKKLICRKKTAEGKW